MNAPPSRKRWFSRRWFLATVAVLLAVALAVAHVVYWYLPRLRTGRPGGTVAAALLASEAFPASVWVPYPHQNLAMMDDVARGATTGESELVEAVARLAGLPEPRWPVFGPLRMPPAHEMAFAAGGERAVLVAEVFPLPAAFAKLSGRLADNPWLAGGEVLLDGREAEVRWQGSTWMVGMPDLPRLEPAPEATGGPFQLLVLSVRQVRPPLPAGRYRLTIEDGDLLVRSEAAVASGLELEGRILHDLGLFLLLAAGERPVLDEPAQGMAFFTQDGAVTVPGDGEVYELPGMAVVHGPGGDRWTLPGEKILGLTGRDAYEGDVDGWSVAALDEASYDRVRELVPSFTPLLEPRPAGRLAWGLWLDLDLGTAEVSRISRALDAIPLVSEEKKARWNDSATVLEALARPYKRLSVVITDEPRALRLELEGRAAAAE